VTPREPSAAFVWAFEDETRAEILRLISDKKAIGARRVADELGLPRPLVSRLLSQMHRKGLLEQVGSQARRGVFERLFSITEVSNWLSDDEWAALPPSKKKKLFLAILRPLIKNLSSVINSETYGLRPDCWCGTATRTVDDQGWQDLVDIYNRAFKKAQCVFEESSERMGEAAEDGIRASATMLLFNVPKTDVGEKG
jgi:DNA-binding transcriptional ArsR family regulator